MRKKFPLFYKIYFSVIAIFLVLLAVAVSVVRGYLADYEASLPEHEASRVFERYFESRDYSSLLSQSTYKLSKYETYQNLLEHLKATTDGEQLSYSRVSSGSTDAYKYVVKTGDKRLCTFTLAPSEEKSKKGFTLYSLDSLDLSGIENKKSVKVLVPEDTVLYINGVPVGDDCITGRDIPTKSCEHMPEGVRGVYLSEYVIEGLIAEPSIIVKASDGKQTDLRYDDTDKVWRAEYLPDASLVDELGAYVTEAAEKYAVYTQGDCGFGSIKGYYDPTSPLYTNIRTLENMFVIDHSSWSFEDEKISEFYRYDEGTVSCRVSFVHILHKPGTDDYRDYIDMTLYLRNVNGKYLIYDRYNN